MRKTGLQYSVYLTLADSKHSVNKIADNVETR